MNQPGMFYLRVFRFLKRPALFTGLALLGGCMPTVNQNSKLELKSEQKAEPKPEYNASRELPNLIRAGIESGQKIIRIPEGRYHVLPSEGIHLELRDLQGFTLDMRGVEMICTESTLALRIENCEGLTIRGLTVDYDPLPFTQGELIEISQDRKTHLIKLAEGFPPAEAVIASKYILFSPDGDLRYGSYYQFETEGLPDNHLRISGLHPRKDGGEQTGDLITISAQHLQGRFRPHAIHLERSVGTVLEDITLYASPTFGFFETHCSGSVYRRCIVDRKDKRLRSLNADGFHSKFAEVGPLLEECLAYWQGDDGINICGAYHLVIGSEGDRLRVLAKREMDILPGDPVQLVQLGGRPLPNAKVLSVTETGPATEAQLNSLEGVPVLQNVKQLLTTAYEIQIDTPVEMEPGGVIGSLNRMGNGFVIRGCEFGFIRSRGILVKASNGLIEDNLLDHCGMQGIKVAPEYNWLESGFSENVTIRNNRIIQPGKEGILVDSIGPHPMHRNLEILNNTITTQNLPAVRIQGVSGGSFLENEIRGFSAGQNESAVSVSDSSHFRRDQQNP